MLVDDVAAGFDLPQFRMAVMEKDITLKQVTDDIHKGIFKISKYDTVIVSIGRQDVVHRRNYKSALNKLIHALCTFGRNTSFVMTGPLPGPWDNRYVIRDLLHAAVITKRRINNLPGFKFCDVTSWFADRDGIKQQFIDHNGLTRQAKRLLADKLITCV